MRSPLRRALCLAALLAGAPAIAEAHLVATGMGPLYDGVSHFGLSPEDIAPVVALGLFAGLRGPATARPLLAVLPLAWLAGGMIALSGAALPQAAQSAMTVGLFLALGGLLALDARLEARSCLGLAAILGLARGLGDLSGSAFSGPNLFSLAGMAGAAAVVFALATSVSLPLRRFWMIIAVRVGGSWLAALGLLMAGWIWRYGARVA